MDVLRRQWTGEDSKAGADVVTYITSVYQRMEKAADRATQFEREAKQNTTTGAPG